MKLWMRRLTSGATGRGRKRSSTSGDSDATP
jgi:hypothetical protein